MPPTRPSNPRAMPCRSNHSAPAALQRRTSREHHRCESCQSLLRADGTQTYAAVNQGAADALKSFDIAESRMEPYLCARNSRLDETKLRLILHRRHHFLRWWSDEYGTPAKV